MAISKKGDELATRAGIVVEGEAVNTPAPGQSRVEMRDEILRLKDSLYRLQTRSATADELLDTTVQSSEDGFAAVDRQTEAIRSKLVQNEQFTAAVNQQLEPLNTSQTNPINGSIAVGHAFNTIALKDDIKKLEQQCAEMRQIQLASAKTVAETQKTLEQVVSGETVPKDLRTYVTSFVLRKLLRLFQTVLVMALRIALLA